MAPWDAGQQYGSPTVHSVNYVGPSASTPTPSPAPSHGSSKSSLVSNLYGSGTSFASTAEETLTPCTSKSASTIEYATKEDMRLLSVKFDALSDELSNQLKVLTALLQAVCTR